MTSNKPPIPPRESGVRVKHWGSTPPAGAVQRTSRPPGRLHPFGMPNAPFDPLTGRFLPLAPEDEPAEEDQSSCKDWTTEIGEITTNIESILERLAALEEGTTVIWDVPSLSFVEVKLVAGQVVEDIYYDTTTHLIKKKVRECRRIEPVDDVSSDPAWETIAGGEAVGSDTL